MLASVVTVLTTLMKRCMLPPQHVMSLQNCVSRLQTMNKNLLIKLISLVYCCIRACIYVYNNLYACKHAHAHHLPCNNLRACVILHYTQLTTRITLQLYLSNNISCQVHTELIMIVVNERNNTFTDKEALYRRECNLYNKIRKTEVHSPALHSPTLHNNECEQILNCIKDDKIPINNYIFQQAIQNCTSTEQQLLDEDGESVYDKIQQLLEEKFSTLTVCDNVKKEKEEVRVIFLLLLEEKEEVKVEIEKVKEEENSKSEEENTGEDTEDCTITKDDWDQMTRTQLYANSNTSVLEALLLVHQYIINSNTNKTYSSQLVQMMHFLLPHPSNFPQNYNHFMKVHHTHCRHHIHMNTRHPCMYMLTH